MVGEDARARDTAEVRRDDDDIVKLLGAEVIRDDRSSCQVIDWDVEEALDLAGMEVNRHDAGDTSRRHEVRHELRRDWLAAARLAVLTCIGVIRDDSRDAVCRSALAGICHDQELHEVVVDRIRRRLNDEDILATDALADHDLRLTVVEMTDICIAEVDADMVGNLLREIRVCITGQDA